MHPAVFYSPSNPSNMNYLLAPLLLGVSANLNGLNFTFLEFWPDRDWKSYFGAESSLHTDNLLLGWWWLHGSKGARSHICSWISIISGTDWPRGVRYWTLTTRYVGISWGDAISHTCHAKSGSNWADNHHNFPNCQNTRSSTTMMALMNSQPPKHLERETCTTTKYYHLNTQKPKDWLRKKRQTGRGRAGGLC